MGLLGVFTATSISFIYWSTKVMLKYFQQVLFTGQKRISKLKEQHISYCIVLLLTFATSQHQPYTIKIKLSTHIYMNHDTC